MTPYLNLFKVDKLKSVTIYSYLSEKTLYVEKVWYLL